MKQKLITLLATFTLMIGFVSVPVSSAYAAAVTLDEAIDGATAKMLADSKITSDWEAFAVARSNTPASKELRLDYYNQIVNYLNTETRLSATDYERTIIGVLSVGGDPTNIPEATEHKNLIEDLYRFNVINGGTNAVIYGILALQTKEYDVPEDAVFSIQDLINKLVSVQKADGGWALFGSASDIDITGMAMTALAKYKDMPEVAAALDRSVDYLSAVQLESGGFKGWSNENSNSLSQAIMGITMTGNDPTGTRFTKNFNAIDALMTYRTDDGGFKWLLTDAGSNAMALDQAAYALAQYKAFLTGGASIYDFVNNPVPQLVEIPVDPDPEVTDPEVTDPETTEPEVTNPDPGVTEPETTNPEKEKTPDPTPTEKPTVVEPVAVKEADKPANLIKAPISNTGKNTKSDETNYFPKTGESSEFGIFTALLGTSIVLIGLIVWYENKKKQTAKA
ncbi:prenyltransferase/squalene oxidase repeat-containing protein [Carnobacterium maltaromaticum]|uniref:prenyltransferase/squalene oxidase repeat-containing protein n=1 Tax=Carnobacterium maltaromaticum TaxID=2751 RepID=UPI002152D893|nr:cell wall protein [Carnobacterium maltaromaticum]